MSPPVILNGRVYYNRPGNVFRCLDLRTGELLWEQSGSITEGQIIRAASRDPTTPETESASPQEFLWEYGSTWTRYEAFTGTVSLQITGRPTGVGTPIMYGDIAYCLQQTGWNTTIPNRRSINQFYKLNLTLPGNTWASKIVWNVSLKQPDGTGPGEGNRASGLVISLDNTVGVVLTPGENIFYGFDLNTGQQIWTKDIGHMMMLPSPHLGPDNSIYSPETESWPLVMHRYDVKTGNEIWSAVFDDYPWGVNTRPYGYAYGLCYFMGYDGHVTALNETDGTVVWRFYTGNTTETPYGTWVPFLGPVIADGKYYIGTSEHTPTQPRVRGAKLFCLDALTGEELWRIGDGLQPNAIADGYLLASSEYTAVGYAFGKGLTTTTISAPQTAITKGTTVLLSGTVLDQSPAQPDTPAISDQDMTAWMEYMHMQKPMPTNVNGVPLLLTAVAPDGSCITIGETTSDGYGNFYYEWTPPNTGLYKVQATFAGSNSYWSSTAEAAVSVKAAASASVNPPATSTSPSATTSAPAVSPSTSASASESASPSVAPPPSTESAPSMTLYIAIAVAVVIVAVAAAVLFLKRK
jgi:outer membrane protein assembly factor BamB